MAPPWTRRPQTPPELDVDHRKRPWGVVVPSVVVFVVAPLVALAFSDEPRDVIRSFVLSQATIVFCLFSYSLYNVLRRMAIRPQSQFEREIQRGHACNLLAELMFLALFMEFSFKRLGKPMIDWHTPFLQAVVWLLLLAWLWMERRHWRPLS
jgi:hypothetical protein